jgi:CheY-like chemotaxis protein
MFVDDNKTNRNILKYQLSQWNIDVTVAESGKEGLELFNTKPPFDLIITDMQMYEMDGAQFAGLIKEKEPNMPIILFTSMGDFIPHKDYFATVLNKPLKQQQLLDAIVNVLKLSNKVSVQKKAVENTLSSIAEKFPLTILIAEDNPINQKLASTVLTKMGYHPDIANNGFEAIEKLKNKPYDLILMDVLMPEMDGIEATIEIKKNELYKNKPLIVAVTANALQGDKEKCLVAGMDDYISKPFKMEDLVKALENAYARLHPES